MFCNNFRFIKIFILLFFFLFSCEKKQNIQVMNIEDIIIKTGDLPAGYSGAQIRDVAPSMFNNLPKPKKEIYQQFEKRDNLEGGVTILFYNNKEDVEKAYNLIVSHMGDELENIPNLGDRATGTALDFSNFGVSDVTELLFAKCNSIVHIRMNDLYDLISVTSYAKRLCQRLEPYVCNSTKN